jgi:hypothetical protein
MEFSELTELLRGVFDRINKINTIEGRGFLDRRNMRYMKGKT